MPRSSAFDNGSAVTVAATTTSLAPARPGRTRIALSNMHGTSTVDLSLGTAAAVVGEGIRLHALAPVVIIDGYDGPIQAIASTGTAAVGVTEW